MVCRRSRWRPLSPGKQLPVRTLPWWRAFSVGLERLRLFLVVYYQSDLEMPFFHYAHPAVPPVGALVSGYFRLVTGGVSHSCPISLESGRDLWPAVSNYLAVGASTLPRGIIGIAIAIRPAAITNILLIELLPSRYWTGPGSTTKARPGTGRLRPGFPRQHSV
jgi:hypothetical protein